MLDAPVLLPATQWRAAADAHRARVDELIGGYLAARRSGARQPVIDFLFTYYPYRPALLQRWHPGFGVVLGDDIPHRSARPDDIPRRSARPDDIPRRSARPDVHPYAEQRGYQRVTGGVTASREYLHKRASTLAYTTDLLSATASRPPRLGCFGLHEWAMVYREGNARRHAAPLRLGAAGTDDVVESMSLQCTHYDAYRFFTEPAVGRNALELSRASQTDREQPGCLHASMDLYRLTAKLMPLLGSDLLVRTFELAYAAREIDMRASPYDLRAYGYLPIAIETAAGRAEYVREQSVVAERGSLLRAELLKHTTALRRSLHASEVTRG